MAIDDKYKKEDLIRLIFTENKSYREIGRIYSVSDTYIKKVANKLGLKIKSIGGSQEHPEIHSENFADGKNPGRKGLAKRMGVNTKSSVSSLRKTAKNSSGEKQRMAHWLANMKAGRQKAKKK